MTVGATTATRPAEGALPGEPLGPTADAWREGRRRRLAHRDAALRSPVQLWLDAQWRSGLLRISRSYVSRMGVGATVPGTEPTAARTRSAWVTASCRATRRGGRGNRVVGNSSFGTRSYASASGWRAINTSSR